MKKNLRTAIGLILALMVTNASAGPFTVGLERVPPSTTAK